VWGVLELTLRLVRVDLNYAQLVVILCNKPQRLHSVVPSGLQSLSVCTSGGWGECVLDRS